MSGLKNIFKKPKAPEVPDPVPLPDEEEIERRRRREQQRTRAQSSTVANRLAPGAGATGTEFQRRTLG